MAVVAYTVIPAMIDLEVGDYFYRIFLHSQYLCVYVRYLHSLAIYAAHACACKQVQSCTHMRAHTHPYTHVCAHTHALHGHTCIEEASVTRNVWMERHIAW